MMEITRLLGGGAIALALAASASTALADANLRVVHASPDAPAVDILVNGAVAIPGLAFNTATGYVALPGGSYQIEVVPAGLEKPVVIDATVDLADGVSYTALAVGTLATIEPLVVVDDRSPVLSGARVRFVHASPDAPAVDVAIADGGPVLFGNFSFKEFSDGLVVPAGTYDLEVRLAGTDTVVLPLPGIALGEGFAYTAVATGLAFGTPALGALLLTDVAPPAEVRVIHASPDAPAVDVLVNGDTAISNLSFSEATDYLAVPAGDYDVAVIASGTKGPAVIEATLSLAEGTAYSVLAINQLMMIQPLVLVDDRSLPGAETRVRFVHASPDAPAVDIALAGGAVLFGNVSFGGVGDAITVPAGTYDLEVRLAGTSTVVLPLPGVKLDVNTAYTVVAIGLVGGSPSLGAAIYVDASGPSPAGPADLDRDGIVGAVDLAILLADWKSTDSDADLNGDGVVGAADLGLLLGAWTI